MKPGDFGHGMIDVTSFGMLPDRAGMCECGDWLWSGPEWEVTARHEAHAAPFDPSVKDARMKAVQERRRSGAAGKHADRRSRRIRMRSAARRKAIEDQ